MEGKGERKVGGSKDLALHIYIITAPRCLRQEDCSMFKAGRLHRGTLCGGGEEDCRLDFRDQGGFVSLAILLTLSHVGGMLEQRQLCK